MSYTYDDIRHFVEQQSPSSSKEDHDWMTDKLIEIMQKHDEPPARAWIIEEYWK